MQTITLGKTRYIISDARVDILAAHAACTGKHKRVKSKGAEKRDYPAYWPDMSTAEYVALYEGKNARKNIGPWDWQPLNTAPAAQYTSADSFEVQA